MTTSDYLAFHAAETPQAPALIENGRTITFAEFHRDQQKFSAAARALGLPPGAAVAIGCRNVYVHWQLLLAFEDLGIAASAYLADEGRSASRLIESVDLVMAEAGFPTAGARRVQAIDAQWLAAALAAAPPPAPIRPAGPDDCVRIVRTSGTTGTPKRLALSRRQFELWVERWSWCFGLTPHARHLITIPLVAAGRHTLATAFMRAGAAVIAADFETGAGLARAIADHRITHIILLPVQLKELLDALPAGYAKPANLTIGTIGAAVSPALRQRTVERLAAEVIVFYGSNEIPFIAESRAGTKPGTATVYPWVEAQIVDDAGAVLPFGKPGAIRLKADNMAAGYIDDPATTGRMFRGGWFYPGDNGILHAPRQLQLIGRGDELINVGGQKVAPEELEELVLRHSAAADAGASALVSADGVAEIYIGAVCAPGEIARVTQQVGEAFRGLPYGTIYVARLERIPRNATGKIERAALREAIAKAARGEA